MNSRVLLLSLSTLSMIMCFQNCGHVDNYDIGVSKPQDSSISGTNPGGDLPGGPNDPGNPGNPGSPGYHTNTFSVPTSAVDVLIVDDNSGSMATEQQRMGTRFPDFIQSLDLFDWQLGITTTDMAGTGPLQNGNLINFNSSGNPLYVINRSITDANLLFTNTVQRPEMGSGDERGLYAAYNAIESNSRNLFRANYDNSNNVVSAPLLAIIILSDENERSSGTNLELRDRPETLVQLVHNKWQGKKALMINSIILRPNDMACSAIQASDHFGTVYAEASQLTRGVIGDICADNYGAQLTEMGNRIRSTVDTFTLDCSPLNGIVKYKIDGVLGANSGLTLSGNSATISPAPAAGSMVQFEYNCP